MDFFENLKNRLKKKFLLNPVFTVVGFILILCLSWFYLSQPSWNNEEEQIHSFLQHQFQTLVSDLVSRKHSEVDKITFHKVWTKTTDEPHKIKIFFSYSLRTKGKFGGDTLIEGTALLEKSFEKEGLWMVQDFQVTDHFLDFSEPLVIRASPLPKSATTPSGEQKSDFSTRINNK